MRSIRLLLTIAILTSCCSAAAATLDGRLGYLRSTAPAKATSFTGSIRFARPPLPADLDAMHGMGLRFFDGPDGRPLGSRTVFPVHIPFAAVDRLAASPLLTAVECAWRPDSAPPLHNSRPQIEADIVWELPAPGGGTVTGEGVTVCDIDTGVNYLHPMFFELGEASYELLDVNGNGFFNPGDAVDLDGDGVPDPDEILSYRNCAGVEHYGNGAGYHVGFDFLYIDENGNGQRDVGPPAFDESDPGFGEPAFVTEDLDGNGLLTPTDRLRPLAGSKVRAIWNKDGTVYRRGVDLLDSERDDWGHGTQVTGIFGGGWGPLHHMSGIAPGVESLHVDYDYVDEPPFLIPVEAGMAWSVAEGADIVLIEDGEWVWEYLDGSSNLEIMINEFATDEGVIFICPVGNLATGNMHAAFHSTQVQRLQADADATILWPSFLWTDPHELSLRVAPPSQPAVWVPLDGSTVVAGGYRIYSQVSISPRGTHRMDLRLATDPEGGSVGGNWFFQFTGDATDLHAYFGDSDYGWHSDSSWMTGLDQTHTCTWPATADSAIGIAAYSAGNDGDIDAYSGWGPRIDERPCVDIAAPGAIVYSASPWDEGDYTWFSGTSSAGPHAAGAAALMKELMPDLDNGACRLYLRQGAGQDGYTTDPDRWGAGKLRINAAIGSVLSAIAERPAASPRTLRAHPNPFNPSTTLSFSLPDGAAARLRIFALDGREVWSREIPAGEPGARSVVWNGLDAAGRPAASGVYLAHVLQGDHYSAGRITLVK